jgi:hypothetical protein
MPAQDEIAAEQAARAAMAQQRAPGRRRRVLGIDVTKYVGFKRPGLDTTKMFSDPTCILKDPKPGAMYLWRKPNDPNTTSMIAQQIIKAVTMDRVDRASPYSTVSESRVITSEGAMMLVQSPAGLGLFEVNDPAKLTDGQKAQLPGDHWEHSYLSDLADSQDEFAGDLEQLSASARHRATGKFTQSDEAREMIV